jgi:hypothetical protein
MDMDMDLVLSKEVLNAMEASFSPRRVPRELCLFPNTTLTSIQLTLSSGLIILNYSLYINNRVFTYIVTVNCADFCSLAVDGHDDDDDDGDEYDYDGDDDGHESCDDVIMKWDKRVRGLRIHGLFDSCSVFKTKE